jgi:glycosyltransferase involved in cell wall biosynthesis/peptidoglycan/xylan/chitin deacetylase (PgdA/CDA1 family)/2-polyprenyl-3-methyl-5-hydroxy-6-metoxy-1,4-benzoquinol methylase
VKTSLVDFTVTSVELSEPLAPLPTGGRHHVLALARWQGRPLGWLFFHTNQSEVPVKTIESVAVEQLEWPLIHRTLAVARAEPASLPPISVVICTRNRHELLARCLTSFADLEYPTCEVIVVDNAPADDATRLTVERFNARYVREDRPGLDWARNRGIAEAQYEIVAFTDDDTAVDRGWLTGIAAGFENQSVMAVTGLVAPMEMATPAQVLFEHVYKGMGKGFHGRLFYRNQLRPSQLIAIHAVGVGANMAFRRSVFQRIGDFDTALDVGTPASGGGDLDMFHRVVAAGMPLWYEPRALVWHQHRREIPELRQQLYNDGRSFGVYLQKLWKTRSVPRRSVFRFAVWQWGRWLAGRVVIGLLGRHRMPVPLLWAGLRGAIDSPRAYRETYRSDRLVREHYQAKSIAAASQTGVSVIIPAYNAAETLAECLDSIINQTHSDWEMVVIDDGSSDSTLEIARRYAGGDPRITVRQQNHQGVSAARNLGLTAARMPWVLFLDADDWVAPSHLEKMTAALSADSSLDAVHCGWSIHTREGEVIEEDRCAAVGDLFHLLARHPAFIVHACVVRRSLVQAVGGFDPAYSRIQDWVMWQRVSRTGCRFGAVPETLAGYRMQAGSVSSEPEEVLDQGLRAIALGHGPDSSVPTAPPRHATGRPASELPEAQLAFLGWPAGIMLVRGADARKLLEKLKPYPWPDLAAYLGEIIYSAAPRALGRPRSVWSQVWPRVGANVEAFLTDLEKHASSPGLARTVQHDLARRILGDSTQPFPLTIGPTHAVRLEITEPVPDIFPPPGAERLWCAVELDGKRLGTLELPVCAPVVPAVVLKDAMADRFAWTILGHFFGRTVYRQMGATSESRHDDIGWDTLLRETWSEDESRQPPVARKNGWFPVEISAPLADFSAIGAAVVEVQAGGVTVGAFEFAGETLAQAETIRAAINDALGYELCRAVVREALIGSALDDRGLRVRLLEKVAGGSELPREWERLLQSSQPETLTILGRHPWLPVGGSGSRRALLPGRALEEWPKEHSFACYIPELISQPIIPLSSGDPETGIVGTRRFDRHHFEANFARTTDPWSYSTDYEGTKYDQTLELVPRENLGQVLELGCAEGHFTARLAPLAGRLVAADIADLALERAAERCRTFSNIEYLRLDLVTDPLPGTNDLVVCSEVLYYAGSEAQLKQTAARIAEAIKPGGYFLTAHANVVADQPNGVGFAWDVPYGAETIARVFAATDPFHLVREIRTRLYRIQLYRKAASGAHRVSTPEVRQIANTALPAPAIARWIRWEAGNAAAPSTSITSAATDRLPILMYHQVLELGPSARARWQVTPERFERQLKYLRDAGFYSISLQSWRRAMGQRRPLPGRAVLITFDDGYDDFATHAWPLLRKYGFSALLFVVTGRVGGQNDWDPPAAAGDTLLGWDQLRRLRGEGLELGSHSVNHRRLGGLSSVEIVREAAVSRSVLERELGQPVSAFAYPYGDHDAAIQHLAGAAGYDQAFTCEPGRARLNGNLMAQPRIEVRGEDDLPTFIANLEG